MIEYLIVLALGFVLGSWYGSRAAIRNLQQDLDKELEKLIEQNKSLELLRVEKISDCYYAYVGDRFITQSKDLHEFFQEIQRNPKARDAGVDFVKLLDDFPSQDRKLAAKAILDTWVS